MLYKFSNIRFVGERCTAWHQLVHMMIGGNLTSHINESIMRKCERNQTKFMCLPSNSTHATQTLDVACFKLFKVAWHNILNGSIKANVSKRESTIPRDIFPQLFSKLIKVLEEGNKGKFDCKFLKMWHFSIRCHKIVGKTSCQSVYTERWCCGSR